MCKVKRKIGIMGGTFDPIHVGHLILGERAYEQLKLDKVYFMPAGNPPHKKDRKGRATDEQRVEMVRRAIADNPHFELLLLEMNEEGYSYTYRTLERLGRENPDTEYYFIIGADSLFSLETWMKPERILKACTMVVATRNHTPVQRLDEEMERLSQKFGGHFLRLDTLNIDISSQMLREWMAEHKSLKYYVPEAVISFIGENHIYHLANSEGEKTVGNETV
ncbi:MAG: nicotinate-nucleotide adenylyltransferase [Blautia sp.]|jgi:nicotinate-nucleotide adenylyltransferase